MNRDDMKRECEAAGLDWSAVQSVYRETRAADISEHDRQKAIRRDVASRFSSRFGGNLGRVKMAVGVHGAGDYASLREFDTVAAEIAAAYPEIAASGNASADVWEWLHADHPEPTVAESWRKALAKAEREGLRPKAPPVSPDDLLPAPEAARLMDVTPQRVGQLAKQGRLSAVNMGGRWFIPRDVAEAYRRGIGGRPRRDPLADFDRF